MQKTPLIGNVGIAGDLGILLSHIFEVWIPSLYLSQLHVQVVLSHVYTESISCDLITFFVKKKGKKRAHSIKYFVNPAGQLVRPLGNRRRGQPIWLIDPNIRPGPVHIQPNVGLADKVPPFASPWLLSLLHQLSLYAQDYASVG